MKTAIVTETISPLTWAEDWRKLCKINSIKHKVFDSYDPDFIDKLLDYKPDKTLWQSGNIPKNKIKDEMLRQFLDKIDLRILPNWRTHYMYDHKIRQSYLFKFHNIPHPETKVFFHESYALEYIKKAKYPFIIKADGGAGGKSFRFIETKEQAAQRINDAFRGDGRLTGREHEKNIFYVQEYIPAPEIWRVGVFKNKVGFGFIQKTKPETKVANYRGLKVYPPVPQELLDMVLRINKYMKWDWMMQDLIWSEKYKQWLVLEITDTCDAGSPGGRNLTYYRKGYRWIPKEEVPTPQEIIFNLFVLEEMQ